MDDLMSEVSQMGTAMAPEAKLINTKEEDLHTEGYMMGTEVAQDDMRKWDPEKLMTAFKSQDLYNRQKEGEGKIAAITEWRYEIDKMQILQALRKVEAKDGTFLKVGVIYSRNKSVSNTIALSMPLVGHRKSETEP